MKKSTLAALLLIACLGCDRAEKLSIEKTCSEFDHVDAKMLDLIKEINQKHADDQPFLSKFSMEQVYWIQYRDAHLKALYPQSWDRYYRKNYGKDVFNPCKCEEMIRFTEQRIEELNVWLKGNPANQRECPSTRE